MKLALHIIAKDEKEQLQRIVNDYGNYFDEIAIAYDTDIENVREIFKDNPKVKIWEYKWRDDFAHKRNFLAEKTESEYYLRLDTDDIISNPKNLRVVAEKAQLFNMDVVYVPYIYSKDKDGNCNARHWRETIIRKSDNCYWKKPIHENIFVEDRSNFKGVKDDSIAIIHDIDDDHIRSSSERNFKILLKEYEEDKENTDPRTLAYLGRMLMGFGEWNKAIYFLEKLIEKSGWDDDKYYAWIQLAQCNFQINKLDVAVSACNEALSINTEFPEAYCVLCDIYIAKKEYDKAIHWGKIGLTKPEPNTLSIIDPTTYGYKAVMNLGIAYFGQGDFQAAKMCYDKAYALAPHENYIRKQKNVFEEAFETDKYMKNLLWMIQYTRDKDPEKAKVLVESIPKNMYKDERVHKLRHQFMEPVKWDEKSIVLFCGNSWEEWAAPSVHKGIGGSEEAVIYLSKELKKLGYDVTVFNNCGEMEGIYGGVTYKPYWEMNPNDEFNIFIAWRGNLFANGKLKAKRKLIWMHDVPQPDQFKAGEEKTFDKVIVLSNYHKSLLPKHIPDDKIFVSTNGINISDFRTNGVLRDKKRMIYTSSYDRGIQHLLQMWKDIRKEVPDAELHLFYGWETYDKMMEQGHRSPKFKEEMVKLMNQEGVFEHGRVNHRNLIKEFQKSNLYVYPSHFEEISCISAMKAQACGCIPVVVDYAALKETVKEGIRIPGKAGDGDTNERYKQELIKALKSDNEELREKVAEHKEEFSWEHVAKQWHDNIFR